MTDKGSGVIVWERNDNVLEAEIQLSDSSVYQVEGYRENILPLLFEVSMKIFSERVYIKYVGGVAGGFYKFFKRYFVAQGTVELHISWSSNFFKKYFMSPPISFSLAFKPWLS